MHFDLFLVHELRVILLNIIIDHFWGPGRALGPVCVSSQYA